MPAHRESLVSQLTFPANGMRNGSVQNIPRRANAIREVLTAIDNSIGNSGGITEVIISEQLKKNLYLLIVGSSSPCIRTITVKQGKSCKVSKCILKMNTKLPF